MEVKATKLNYLLKVNGNLNSPVFLFVGDTRNNNKRYKHNRLTSKSKQLPFDCGKSATWLRKQLVMANISLADVAFMNSDNKHLLKVVNQVKPLYIISLGQKASTRLAAAHVFHLKTCHPSYLSRFKSTDKSFYKNLKQLYELRPLR